MKEEVITKLDNIKARKTDTDYELYASFKDFHKYIKIGKTYKEKLQIFIMLYVYCPKLEELENWNLQQLLDYIKETDNYYEEDKQYIEKCIKEINKGGR